MKKRDLYQHIGCLAPCCWVDVLSQEKILFPSKSYGALRPACLTLLASLFVAPAWADPNKDDGPFILEGSAGYSLGYDGNDSVIVPDGKSFRRTEGPGIRTRNDSNTVTILGDLETLDHYKSFAIEAAVGVVHYDDGNVTIVRGSVLTVADAQRHQGVDLYATGIALRGDGNRTEISGSVTTRGLLTAGVWHEKNGNILVVSGDVLTSGQGAIAVNTWGSNNQIDISGSVTTTGEPYNNSSYSFGVSTSGQNNTISISGVIQTSGSNADGVLNAGNNNTTNISGSVQTSGVDARGVVNRRGSSGYNLTNISGSIQTTGVDAHGFYQEGGNNIASVSGAILTAGSAAHGIWNKSDSSVTTISGSIQTRGSAAHGFRQEGDNSTATVSGVITTYGDNASAVYNIGDSNSVTVTGTLASLGTNPIAIRNNGSNNTYTINEGARLVGAIQSDGGTNNTLRFDFGSSKSYVFETTGDWILEDMSGRAVVEGSAMAAGVGRAETADEMLFERTQLFLQSIDRGQMRRDLAGDSALWVDPYAFDSKRSASSSDPTVMKYGSNGYGLTLGYDFQAFGLKAQAIGNIQWGKLNIDDNTQDVNNTSWLVGLRLPSFYEAGPVSFSAMAFAGRNQYSGDSQVLTNSTSTGTTTYSSSFGSTQLLFGLGAKYATPLTQSTDLSLKADLYLSQEYMESYQEGPYFSWNSRTLTQGSAFVEIGIDHYLTDPWLIQAKVGANTQTLFSGKDTNYTINNTAVTFSGGQTNDTGLYAMLGTQYQVKDNARVGISVWYGQTTNSVKTIQGMVEAKFLF